MVPRPLPQQIIPVDERQAVLTARHLSERTDAVAAFMSSLRETVDRELAPTLPDAAGVPYPYGRCEEITRAVADALPRSLIAGAHSGGDAVRAFIEAGGIVRHVWGALRGLYFQNAFQFGGLYVDVANDTVVVTKPKVEILPIAESGMENIRDLLHFATIARLYWGGDVWANTVVPSLAPILPMVSASPCRVDPGLQPASDQMIAMMCRRGFHDAEAWVREAPPPPDDVARAILDRCPPDLRPLTDDPRAEALAACRAAATAGHPEAGPWRDQRVADYLRLIGRRPPSPPAETLRR